MSGNEAESTRRPQGDQTHHSVSAESLIQMWDKSLSKNIRILYIAAVVSLLLAFLLSLLNTNYVKLIAETILFFSVISIGILPFSALIKARKSWQDEFVTPIHRLFKTIRMIESQKLELLPEERRVSFTSEHQQRLLELARNILEHQRFIDHVVDNMFEMMFLLNPDGVILKANKSASETLRYQPSELIGQHIRKLFPHAESLVDYYLELEIQFATQGEVRDMELHVQTSEGEILPFSINGVKIESTSGDLLGYTLIAKNMTEIFRLINQLNKSNFDLNKANSELEKRYDEIKKEIEAKEGQRRELEHELATSQLVQKTFLPQVDPHHMYLEASGTSVPAAYCGGDWWNTISLKDKFYVFIGDVTGHGTASAMVTAAISGYYVSVNQALDRGEDLDADAILQGFNSVLTKMASGNVSYNMTLFVCIFDFARRKIRFANAGHNFPLVYRSGKMEPLVVAGNRLGGLCSETFECKEIPLVGEELVFFYTDGLIENKNLKDEPYGKRRLRKFMEGNSERRVSDFVSKLQSDAQDFVGVGRALEDDVTFVAVRIKYLEHDEGAST